MSEVFRDRIKSLRRVKAGDLVANPKNWRRHPEPQRGAMTAALAEIGLADALLVRETEQGLEIIDGHLRADLCADQKVPVLVLDVTAEEADKLLATLDPLAAMAEIDLEALAALGEGIQFDSSDLDAMLAELLSGPESGNGRNASLGSLSDRFGVPPFSVLDARQGYWQERKRAWIALGIRGEEGRSSELISKDSDRAAYGKSSAGTDSEGNLKYKESVGCTSIFDPVLSELVYRWFCPPGGTVLDPFAGGSVRGIVASILGYNYWGCDLSDAQVKANRVQAKEILSGNGSKPAANMRRFEHGGITVLSDPLPGGTKERAFRLWVGDIKENVLVYASPREGFAQIAIARVCADNDKSCVLFVPASKTDSPPTALARAAGAQIEAIRPGYLTQIQAKARDYAREHEAHLLPFGLACEEMIEAISTVAREQHKGSAPDDIWCAAGSGTLTRGLMRAFPNAKLHAVQVGAKVELPGAEDVFVAPEKFQGPARVPPPFSSELHYDAKVWRFCEGKIGLFWNVAEEMNKAAPITATPPPQWVCGDSMERIGDGPDADLIFTCPPYADLESYSDDPADLSTMDYPTFITAYRQIIADCISKLRDDRFACIVVGDVRDSKGNYRNFVSDTIAAFRDAGMNLYNEAILVTAVGSLPIRVGRQFESRRKLGKTHQNVLVFINGDAARAVAALGDVEFGKSLEASVSA